jgi:hypothetical protein
VLKWDFIELIIKCLPEHIFCVFLGTSVTNVKMDFKNDFPYSNVPLNDSFVRGFIIK